MYVLVHKNNVISGPSGWNYAMFNVRLEDLNIPPIVPRSSPELPFTIDSDTRILECEITTSEFNPKTQYLEGPFVRDVSGEKAQIEFVLRNKQLGDVKFNLKQEAATERYKKEISGTTTTINNEELEIDTNRGVRDIFVQKFLLMGDSDVTTWKFPSGFREITKSQLGQIVSAGALHVQQAFDWEKNKVDEIDACTTLEELDAIVIVEQPQAQNGTPQ